LHKEIVSTLYDKGKGTGESADTVGSAIYNRGIQSAIYLSEALRGAMNKYGNKPVTGEQVQWALENFNLDDKRIEELGVTGLFAPVKLSCNDHQGEGQASITQWTGKEWKPISGLIKPNMAMLRPMYEASAAAYAKEKGITPRDCK
jgi:branched-chain amino acid transport system substrate-binding protein